GLWKGFFREIFGIAGLIGGLYLAILTFGPLAGYLKNWLPGLPSFILPALSFILIFLLVYIVSRIIGHLLGKIFQQLSLGWLNRLLGGAIGGLKAAILVSLFLLIIEFLPFQGSLQSIKDQSRFYEPVQQLIPAIYNKTARMTHTRFDFEDRLQHAFQKAKVRVSQQILNQMLHGKTDSTFNK
ncbi:MAG: CvpA family protein, partial [Calditrichia bacterium]